jgi:hypothetical protein
VVSFCYFFPRRVLAAHGTGTTGGPTSPRTGLCCRYLYSKPCRVLSHFLSLQPPVRALGQTCEKISLASLVFLCRVYGYALTDASGPFLDGPRATGFSFSSYTTSLSSFSAAASGPPFVAAKVPVMGFLPRRSNTPSEPTFRASPKQLDLSDGGGVCGALRYLLFSTQSVASLFCCFFLLCLGRCLRLDWLRIDEYHASCLMPA